MSGAPKSSSGPRGAAAFRERGAFHHHGAGVAARHPETGGVGARIHPAAAVRLAGQRPAISRGRIRPPALHGHDLAIDVDGVLPHEPACQLAHGETVPHRHGARADEAFPAVAQRGAFHRPARGVRTIEHPHAASGARAVLEHVAQRGDERIDAAADVLQVHQQHVDILEHGRRGPAHLAVEAEYGNAEAQVAELAGLDHIVLLVATQAVLRAESGGEAHAFELCHGIERVLQRRGDGSGMREQRHAPAREARGKRAIRAQAVDAELHARHSASASVKLSARWKSALRDRCAAWTSR